MSNLSAAYAYGHSDDDYEQYSDGGSTPEPLGLAPDPVEVRRNGGLAAGVGAVASAVSIAYLARATGTGSWLDWLLCLAMGALGVGYLLSFVDARTPLLVADAQGVRIRLGRSWRGLPWAAIAEVEHQPRRGLLRDGRLLLVATEPDRVLDELDGAGRRQAALARRLYGSPFALPLALTTRVTGAADDLTAALGRLADDPAKVVEVVEDVDDVDDVEDVEDHLIDLDPADLGEQDDEAPADDRAPRFHDPRPALAQGIGFLAARLRLHRDEPASGSEEDEREYADVPVVEDPVAEDPVVEDPVVEDPAAEAGPDPAAPSPLRDPVTGARAEIRIAFQGPAPVVDPEIARAPGARELRRPGRVDLVEDAVVWSDRVRPIAREGEPVAPLVIDDFAVEPAEDPVVGPELAAARTRLGLTVDQLAERTRIRPHVIESIEVDDFAPCGGDFYARGHLRTLARVLGTDAAPLLAAYDQRYADAPIDARRVFETELATGAGGPIRSTRGGPNWSVLVAAVMALVLAWSIARLIMDSPIELHTKPVLNGSPGATVQTKLGPPVPVVLDAAKGGAHVVVRDGSGEVVFNGDLAYGATKRVEASPPVRVQSSDGALGVTVDGQDRGALGADGQPAQNTFAAGD